MYLDVTPNHANAMELYTMVINLVAKAGMYSERSVTDAIEALEATASTASPLDAEAIRLAMAAMAKAANWRQVFPYSPATQG